MTNKFDTTPTIRLDAALREIEELKMQLDLLNQKLASSEEGTRTFSDAEEASFRNKFADSLAELSLAELLTYYNSEYFSPYLPEIRVVVASELIRAAELLGAKPLAVWTDLLARNGNY